MNVNGVLGNLEAKFVGCSVGQTGFEAASGHPDREGLLVMIATIATLQHGSTAKFPGPNDQGLVEQSPFL